MMNSTLNQFANDEMNQWLGQWMGREIEMFQSANRDLLQRPVTVTNDATMPADSTSSSSSVQAPAQEMDARVDELTNTVANRTPAQQSQQQQQQHQLAQI
jgi:hypothetical protein